MDIKRKKTIAIVFTVFAIVLLIGTAYAFISRTLTGTKKVTITAGTLSLVLDEKNEITISDALPMYDAVGMIQEEVFEFDLINNTANQTDYVLKIKEIQTGTLAKSDVKYGLIKDGVTTIDLVSNIQDGVIDEGTIAGNDTINYELRLWIDSAVTNITQVQGKFLSLRLSLEASMVEEEMVYQDESGANVPELTSGMIPVVYNEKNMVWEKADTSEAWYDYDEQMWANAVTVTESTRDDYMSAPAGEPISMNDINTMWVWIPRYEYNYLNLGPFVASGETATGETASGEGATEIKVNFISKDAITPSNSLLYKIPEGFKFGNENIAGFWMGKFETSTLESCAAKEFSIGTDCDLTTLTPQVKPNVTSWRGARVSTFFTASRLMQSSDDTQNYNADTYGFDAAGTSSMDVHMLKNTEWGIVAMLSQSKYGKYGNSTYTGANKEVYQNKSNGYITGMSNGTPSQDSSNTQIPYSTPEAGYGASTTGTIYGVYDMSGGSDEYIMGNYNNNSGDSISSNSGFCGNLWNGLEVTENCREWPNAKYYDLYTSDIASEGYKFGDATAETDWFYTDYAQFIDFDSPWFDRGGYFQDGNSTGVFRANARAGQSRVFTSTRFAIKP